MVQSTVLYWREVLGLEWVPLRGTSGFTVNTEPKAGAEPVPGAATGPKVETLLVVVSQPFTPDDEQLLQKMMSAIGVSDYVVSSQLSDGHGSTLILDGEVASTCGLTTPGESKTTPSGRLIFSYELVQLRTGPPPEVQNRKRQAWSHLQQLQSWLKELT